MNKKSFCNLINQGFKKGACETTLKNGEVESACQATLKYENGQYHRVITSMHLSRPEDYFSIYQSGCNHNCLKCHSFEFSKYYNGKWMSSSDIKKVVDEYYKIITVFEPKERATSWHAQKLCRHCGF